MASRRRINLCNIEEILDEIPSDGSFCDDEDSSEESDIEQETLVNDLLPALPELCEVEEQENNDDNLTEEESDSDDDIPLVRLPDHNWKKRCITPKVPEFHEPEGVIDDTFHNGMSPVDVFYHLLGEDTLENIVFQTNLYSTQEGKPYKNADLPEIKVFLALNLLLGIKLRKSYRECWSSSELLRDDYISSKMNVNRFSWLLSHLHLNDNSIMPPHGSISFDKLYRVRPFIENLRRNFKTLYHPTKIQAVDESMIRFKGRSTLKQYMPMKPVKRGYKVWVRADKNGFVCDFQIYTGKVGQSTEKDLGARVVKDLCQDLKGKNYHIYFDRYFSSVNLIRELKAEKIFACGTILSNRKNLPTDLAEDRKLKRGDFDWRMTGDGLGMVKWKDTKSVYVVSSLHKSSDSCTKRRKQKDGSYLDLTYPTTVRDYTANMGCVDKADLLKTFYQINRKSRKWWHRIFWHFIDVTIVNSYIIYKKLNPDIIINLKNFRLRVIEGLIGAATQKLTPGPSIRPREQSKFKKYVPIEKRFDRADHMPMHGKPRRCARCSTKKEVHTSRWSCTTCDVGLCLNNEKNCFAAYHQKN